MPTYCQTVGRPPAGRAGGTTPPAPEPAGSCQRRWRHTAAVCPEADDLSPSSRSPSGYRPGFRREWLRPGRGSQEPGRGSCPRGWHCCSG